MMRATSFFILFAIVIFITCEATSEKPPTTAQADLTQDDTSNENPDAGQKEADVDIDPMLDQFIEENKHKLNLDADELDEMMPHINRKVLSGQGQKIKDEVLAENKHAEPDHLERFEDNDDIDEYDEEDFDLPHNVRISNEDDDEYLEDFENDVDLPSSAHFFDEEEDGDAHHLDSSVHMANPDHDTGFAHNDGDEDYDYDDDDDLMDDEDMQ